LAIFSHEIILDRPLKRDAIARLKGLEHDFIVLNIGLDLRAT